MGALSDVQEKQNRTFRQLVLVYVMVNLFSIITASYNSKRNFDCQMSQQNDFQRLAFSPIAPMGQAPVPEKQQYSLRTSSPWRTLHSKFQLQEHSQISVAGITTVNQK